MSAFVVVTFAQMEMLLLQSDKFRKLLTDGSVKLCSSVVITRDPSGKISVRELTAEGLATTAVGALITAGLPLGPVAAMIGEASRALIGNSTKPVDEDEGQLVKAIARDLKPGEGVVVAELDDDGLIAFEAAMREIGGGTVIHKEQNQIKWTAQ